VGLKASSASTTSDHIHVDAKSFMYIPSYTSSRYKKNRKAVTPVANIFSHIKRRCGIVSPLIGLSAAEYLRVLDPLLSVRYGG